MRKIVKSTVAVASAVAMSVSLFASVPSTAKASDLSKSKAVYDPAVLADGEVYYTLAGGCGNTAWSPLSENNTMTETEIDGVYSMELNLEAYAEADEWKNRFKICQIDNTVFGDGWDHSILLGTGLYGDSETQFRIENAEAGKFTVFFEPKTGAVIVEDASGALVDYTISWAGNEKDAPIIKAGEGKFLTCAEAEASKLEDWETNKLPASVTEVPAFTKVNEALATKITAFDPSELADGETVFTLAGGCGATAWNPLGRANKFVKTDAPDVYAIELTVGAYDAETEWNNRFKICQIDKDVIDAGWSRSILLGTGLYGDSETQFRIENAEAGTFTVYYDAKTGAVIIKDANGELVDYTISWAGNEKDAPIIKAGEGKFLTCAEAEATKLEDWETDKIPAGVTEIPAFTKVNEALAAKVTSFDPSELADGETVFTLAGGCGATAWNPLGRANKFTETRYAGVYAIELTVGAYDAETEWNNRFKICQIDKDVIDAGWTRSILLGTGFYGDSETQFRIENAEAGTFTVYYDAKTGAVVIQDANGALVDYTISWAGNEKDAPIIKAGEGKFLTCAEAEATKLEDWETDKIPTDVTEIPKFTEINKALADKISKVPSQVVEPAPIEVTLAVKASTKTIYTGKASNTAKITATVTGTDEKVTFKSSNKKIAKVSKTGKVTAVKAGKVTITATVGAVSKSVKITVKNPTITVKAGSKKVTKVTVKKGKTAKLSVATNPKKATFKAALADKASKKVVKLSTKKSTVSVKGLKKGTAKIKVTSGGATKTIKVTVK